MNSFTAFVLILTSCHSPKAFVQPIRQNNALTDAAKQFIDHLNNRNFDQLEAFYHPNFQGLSPVVKFESKEELLRSIRTNYSTNQNQIKASILECQTGLSLGYIVFQWQLRSPAPDDTWKVVLDKKMLSIWQINQAGQWQISRMLFFNELEGYGVEGMRDEE